MEKITLIACPLSEIGARLGNKELYVIFDRNVEGIVRGMGLSARGMLPIDASERTKVPATVVSLAAWLMEEGASREAFVLGVGGGITTDIVGFTASVYKRGVRFGFVPTTLLAQVDAAVGGKNGVNLDSYKNMLGTIRQSEMTFLCPEVLHTLPRKEIVAGAAELLKTFIIDNQGGNYGKAVETLGSKEYDFEELGTMTEAAARIKAGIAGRDPFEKGERMKLNLGHTFAHAIEKLSAEGISHGNAVSMGIILAARLAEGMGFAREGLARRLTHDFERCTLPVECPYAPGELASAMEKDKKANGSIVHFVLPVDIGKVEICDLGIGNVVGTLNHLQEQD